MKIHYSHNLSIKSSPINFLTTEPKAAQERIINSTDLSFWQEHLSKSSGTGAHLKKIINIQS